MNPTKTAFRWGILADTAKSYFYQAKQAGDEQLKWEGYKSHEYGDDCIMSPYCSCDDCERENVKMD